MKFCEHLDSDIYKTVVHNQIENRTIFHFIHVANSIVPEEYLL